MDRTTPPSGHEGASVVSLSAGEREPAPLICFSHLRWDFVFQRPQHLMNRFAAARTVIYFEEPIGLGYDETPRLDTRDDPSGVVVATPRVPDGLGAAEHDAVLRQLLDGMLADRGTTEPVLWYYTPMMLPFSRHLTPSVVVYDCMDELANFRFAPPGLRVLEQELISTADVIFTGGYSLYEAKQHLHANIHPFPSSVDRAHFGKARGLIDHTAHRPKLGFYGVIDERMDLELIAAVADARPDWTIVMVGPVVKISPDELPRRPNIEYPGGADYSELPARLAGWDVAIMPFAINDSTRFISPTKTPEYLSAGKPVVSTSIRDVVRHYGELDAVGIADTPEAFVAACEAALTLAEDPSGAWLSESDEALADLSWDQTYVRMNALIERASTARANKSVIKNKRARAPSQHYDALVVGAGFAGSVLAERLAAGSDQRVLVIDRRPHIAGNAYDRLDDAGVMIHQYGPHIFHTNSSEVFAYLSRFTRWRPYEHRVLAQVGERLVPMPINRTTLNAFYGLDLNSDEEAAAFLASRAEPTQVIKTSEDVVVAAVGRELYETFFQGYTRKQWGLDPSQLDKSVTSRVPTRTNTDDRYFTDTFQAMPLDGYTAMFERMLSHENIEVRTGVEYADVASSVSHDRLIFTGPVDEFFDHRFGRLPYRSLKFRHETVDREVFQPTANVNYPDETTPHTRITEYKHLTGQSHPKTSITYEYPTADGDPYYPVPRPENQALYKRYEALAAERSDVTFVGRLATYKYYNMDQVVGQALANYRRMAPVLAADRSSSAAAEIA